MCGMELEKYRGEIGWICDKQLVRVLGRDRRRYFDLVYGKIFGKFGLS